MRSQPIAHHSVTRRYGLSKVVRRAKVLAVEPVFAADYDAAAHLQAGRPPRMPTAFRLALDDGSTLTAKRVVAAVRRTLLAACEQDGVCRTSVVACCTLHVMWWSGPPLMADAVHSHAHGRRDRVPASDACTHRTERRPQGMRLAQQCTRRLQVGPNSTPRIPSWAHAHLVRQPSHMVCADRSLASCAAAVV